MLKNRTDDSIESYFGLMLYTVQILMDQQHAESNDEELNLNGTLRRKIQGFSFDFNDIRLEPSYVEEMENVLEFERTLAKIR